MRAVLHCSCDSSIETGMTERFALAVRLERIFLKFSNMSLITGLRACGWLQFVRDERTPSKLCCAMLLRGRTIANIARARVFTFSPRITTTHKQKKPWCSFLNLKRWIRR